MAWASNVVLQNEWASNVPLNVSASADLPDFSTRDEAFAWFRSQGYSGTLEDMTYYYLLNVGMTPASRLDMLREYDSEYYSRNLWIQGPGKGRFKRQLDESRM